MPAGSVDHVPAARHVEPLSLSSQLRRFNPPWNGARPAPNLYHSTAAYRLHRKVLRSTASDDQVGKMSSPGYAWQPPDVMDRLCALTRTCGSSSFEGFILRWRAGTPEMRTCYNKAQNGLSAGAQHGRMGVRRLLRLQA